MEFHAGGGVDEQEVRSAATSGSAVASFRAWAIVENEMVIALTMELLIGQGFLMVMPVISFDRMTTSSPGAIFSSWTSNAVLMVNLYPLLNCRVSKR